MFGYSPLPPLFLAWVYKDPRLVDITLLLSPNFSH